MVRHAAINCGESDLIPELDLYQPERWNPDFVEEKVKGRRRHSASVSVTTDVVPDNGDQMYDFAKDCWVQNTMGTEVSSQVAATIPSPKKKRKPKKKKKKKSKRSKPKRKQVKKKK